MSHRWNAAKQGRAAVETSRQATSAYAREKAFMETPQRLDPTALVYRAEFPASNC
jgi:hypothetical protein